MLEQTCHIIATLELPLEDAKLTSDSVVFFVSFWSPGTLADLG